MMQRPVPPSTIPQEHYSAFTVGGRIPVINAYRNDQREEGAPHEWSVELTNQYLSRALQKLPTNYDSDAYLYAGLDALKEQVQGKECAVIGSEVPAYEAILLSYGVKPFTIEYNQIHCSDARLNTRTVEEFRRAPRTFDLLLSVSSIEHDGLGRYGDPVDPNGDLACMKRAKEMLKPGGLFFLQVPVGPDALHWNCHRIYGSVRLPLLLREWRIIASCGYVSDNLLKDLGPGHQPLFILTPGSAAADNLKHLGLI